MKSLYRYFPLPTPFVVVALLSTFHTAAEISALAPPSEHECQWRHNITDLDKVSNEKVRVLENCLYYYLVDQEMKTSGDGYQIFLAPPWETPLKVVIDHYVVHQVDALQKASSQFNIHGDIFLSWKDTRLTWNETEWKMKEFALHDTHHIWTPTFTDESSCGIMDGCMSRIADVEVMKDGTVTARLTFRYPAFCGIDYYRYPEETNDCCLFLSVLETERTIKYEIQTKEKASVDKPVSISTIEKDKGITVLTNVETSAWTVQDRTVEVVKIGGFRSEFLRLCVHTKKEMSTLRIALRIPVTIATLLMLVSPLFGDLKTQSYVKLFTLTLQTICFLFMCSIAPVNGFAGTKPKLYTFYEFLFFLSAFSVLVTLICLALCRVKRTVPPSHSLYLAAKLINRFVCCIEPDPATSYQRHLEDGFDSGRPNSANDVQGDYTMEWRHIYIAANNLFSGISFSIFCCVIIFDIL